jgi:hypothetical protein
MTLLILEIGNQIFAFIGGVQVGIWACRLTIRCGEAIGRFLAKRAMS